MGAANRGARQRPAWKRYGSARRAEAPAEQLPTLRVDAPLPARAGRGDLVADEGRLRVIRDQAANRLAPRSVHPDSSYVPGVVARDEDEESFDRDDSTHIRGSSISVSSRSGSGGCSDGHRCSRVPASPGRRRLTQDSCCEWNYSRSPAALRASLGSRCPRFSLLAPPWWVGSQSERGGASKESRGATTKSRAESRRRPLRWRSAPR